MVRWVPRWVFPVGFEVHLIGSEGDGTGADVVAGATAGRTACASAAVLIGGRSKEVELGNAHCQRRTRGCCEAGSDRQA
jgi:hypothetical protein